MRHLSLILIINSLSFADLESELKKTNFKEENKKIELKIKKDNNKLKVTSLLEIKEFKLIKEKFKK